MIIVCYGVVQVLFCIVVMMVLDYVLIGEIMLYFYGFVDVCNLLVKIVIIYKLCLEQVRVVVRFLKVFFNNIFLVKVG